MLLEMYSCACTPVQSMRVPWSACCWFPSWQVSNASLLGPETVHRVPIHAHCSMYNGHALGFAKSGSHRSADILAVAVCRGLPMRARMLRGVLTRGGRRMGGWAGHSPLQRSEAAAGSTARTGRARAPGTTVPGPG